MEKTGPERRLTIGVLIGNASSSHTAELMDGIDAQARACGVNVIYYLGMHSGDSYRAVFGSYTEAETYDYQCNVVYDYALLGRADMLIVSYGSLCIFLEHNDREAFLRRFAGIPCVLVEERDALGRCTSLITDNYGGMRRLAEHIVQVHGCRRVAYLAGPKGNTDAAQRRAAVCDVMRENGVPFDESHIEYGDFSVNVSEQAEALLARFPDLQALLCANDRMAGIVYNVCRAHGREPGRDLAVTGFDDDPRQAHLDPPLTTVRQNAVSMGRMAVDKALALYRGGAPESIVDAAPLVLRRSCGCPAQAGPASACPDADLRPPVMRNEIWFMSLISRGMIENIEDEAAFYGAALQRMPAMGARSCYLYLLEKPLQHGYGEPWQCPPRLYLAAEASEGAQHTWRPGARPVITPACGFGEASGRQDRYSLCAYPLFSGRTQHGLLLAEVEPRQAGLIYLASQQINVGLEFHELNCRQKAAQAELESTNRMLNEKNEILAFLSRYDPLTDCLNRRGFLERA